MATHPPSSSLPPLAIAPDRCAVIAEVAQGHDGSLGLAHSFVDLAAAAGVDAVKFQTHIAAAESRPDEPWRVRFSYEDASRYAYWQRMEFTEAQWAGLRDHCVEAGIGFVSSAFSLEAVDLLRRVGVSAWKVASGETLSADLLATMCGTDVPVLVSTGMSTYAEIADTVAACRSFGTEPVLLQCTSMYPTPPEQLGLEVMTDLRARHDCPVGLSDHSGTIYPGIAAVALGAVALEVHLTFSRSMFGPDVPVSLEPAEMADLVRGVRFLERARRSPVDKDAVAADLGDMRRLFGKSLVATRPLPAGTVLAADHLTARKPATGIPAADRARMIGRTLRRSVAEGQALDPSDLRDRTLTHAPPTDPPLADALGPVVISEPWALAPDARHLLAAIGPLREGPFERPELLAALGDARVLVVRLGHRIDRELLEAAPNLRVIGSPTTGVDHLDLAAAAEHGVEVVTLRGELELLRTIRATPEHTWALLLALARRLPTAARAGLDPPWDRDAHRGVELAGKRVGIFGLGRVGEIVAGYARAFGMSVAALDTQERHVEGVEMVASLPDLLERSDVLLVHVPLAADTEGAIGAAELARLPRGALLVNTARGPILDEAAVVRSLEDDHLGGVAVDVLDGELDPDRLARSPLLAYARQHPERAIVTPHIAGATWDSMHRTEVFVAQRVHDLVVGGA